MRIDIYTLLGLVKDGKAPKKIKYEYSIYELTPERNDYYCKNEMRWFTNEINALGVLNNEVEIIEEPKKIEKIDEILMIDDLIPPYQENEYKVWKNIIIQQNKINELIDELNKLKGKIK